MTNSISRILFSALFLALGAVPAHAAQLNVALTGADYHLSDNSPYGTNSVDSNANLTTNSVVNVSLSNAAIVSGNETGMHVLNGGIENGASYLSVYSGGLATFTLLQPAYSFAFNWGTVDSYNTVNVKDVDGGDYLITGAAIIAANNLLAANKKLSLTAGTSSLYFLFNADAKIKSITLASTSNSFEISNLKISSVPLPAALPLFGLGLAALAGYGAKRSRKTTA